MNDDTVEVETIAWDVADDERPTVRLRRRSPVERLLADAIALHDGDVIVREID